MLFYILGGEGFLGSSFCRYFKKNNIKFISITRKNYKKYSNTKCDTFINCNGNSIKWLSDKNYSTDFEKTVISTHDSIKDFKFKKYILISSGEVYNKVSKSKNESCKIFVNGLSNYGFNKLIAEEIIKRSSSKYLIFRMGGFVGRNLKKNLIYDLINDKKIWVSKKSTFQYIDVDQATEMVIKVHKKYTNQVLNLTGKTPISTKDILKLLNKKKVIFSKNSRLEKNNLSIKKINKILNVPETKKELKNFYDNIKNSN